MSNKKIEELLHYSRIPMNTPDMTSSSVNGFTASNEIGYFNSNTYRLTYSGETGMLYFPTGTSAFLNQVYIGSNYGGNAWYFSRYDTIILYYQGVVQATLHFDPIAYAGSYYNFSEVRCDQIYHAYGAGSSWDGNGGQAYIGKKFFGYWA
jgi:hypothetical protein